MLSSKQLADTILREEPRPPTPSSSSATSPTPPRWSSIRTTSSRQAGAAGRRSNARSTAKARRCSGAPATPMRPISSSAKTSCRSLGHRRAQVALRPGHQPVQSRTTAGRPPLSGPIHRRQSPVDRPATEVNPLRNCPGAIYGRNGYSAQRNITSSTSSRPTTPDAESSSLNLSRRTRRFTLSLRSSSA